MLEAIERILGVLMPLLVAVTTVYGGIMVAKLNKVKTHVEKVQTDVSQVQKDIVTNHGSKNIGDAIDRLTTKVNVMSDNQDQLITDVQVLKARDETLDTRIAVIEGASLDTQEVSHDTQAVAHETMDVVTHSIRVVNPFHHLITKLRSK